MADKTVPFVVATFIFLAILSTLLLQMIMRRPHAKGKTYMDEEALRKQQFRRIMNDRALQSPESRRD